MTTKRKKKAEPSSPVLPVTSAYKRGPKGFDKLQIPAEQVIANIDRWKKDWPEYANDPFLGPFYEKIRKGAVERLEREKKS